MQVYFHPKAEAEYLESAIWYEQQSVGLGLRFMASVRLRLESIRANPESFAKKKGQFREALVDNTFPFLIVFVVESEDVIFVSSIFHTSRSVTGKYRTS